MHTNKLIIWMSLFLDIGSIMNRYLNINICHNYHYQFYMHSLMNRSELKIDDWINYIRICWTQLLYKFFLTATIIC